MKYMGSKSRHSKEILPIMLKNRGSRWWFEPFVGGGNIIDKVEGNRMGSDINPYVIAALRNIRDDVLELPKNNREFTEEDYQQLREDDSCWFKGYAAFAFSYGGKFMGGWGRDKEGKRDYVAEAYKNALKQSSGLQGVPLVTLSYDEVLFYKDSVIYCDPPYAGATKYKDNFDHNKFWEWCRARARDGHQIFISEYSAPEDFVCLWEKEVVSSLTKDTGSKKAVEKLFTYIC